MKRILLSFLLVLVCIPLIHSEGTRELAPNEEILLDGFLTNDIAALMINNSQYGSFATWGGNDANARLYINIQDPSSECINLGFSGAFEYNVSSNELPINFKFRILDPDGNVVYESETITPDNARIKNWSDAYDGPRQFNANGYEPYIVSSDMLTSGGNTEKGNYYIEFQNLRISQAYFLIPYFDITVADCSGTEPVEKKGRLWSYNWSLFSLNDFGSFVRPFNGSFYVCAPDAGSQNGYGFISKIDFNASGFRPAAFNILFNSFGINENGTIEENRRSVVGMNSATPEYEIFLNDPVDLCQTAELGSISFNSFTACGSEYCLNVETNKIGVMEVLLDLHQSDGVYTQGTADRLINFQVGEDDINHEICIPWDGLDGNGNTVTSSEISVILNYAQAVYHFPVFDAEVMETGFSVESIRPTAPKPLLYYDDRNIDVDPMTGSPKVQLDGCVSPCHTWTGSGFNFLYGNNNTINTWWYSNSIIVDTTLALPNTFSCNIFGVDELCENETGVLVAEITTNPPGGTIPADLEVTWEGDNITNIITDYDIEITGPGAVTATYTFTQNGQECSFTCSKTVVLADPDSCCVIEITCPSNMSTTVACVADISEFPSSLSDLEDMGITVSDTSCFNFTISGNTEYVDGRGCDGSPARYLRTVNVFDDTNDDGNFDSVEDGETCIFTIMVIDEVAPELEFNHPLLEDIENGGTLFYPCQANADSSWTLPDFGPNPVLVSDNCSQPNIQFREEIISEGNCMDNGFLARYKCVWTVKDTCGREDSIFFYLNLIDETPPVFHNTPDDITIICGEELPETNITAVDNCQCCNVQVETSSSQGSCEEGNVLLRTWIATDLCGNTSTYSQEVTLIDNTPPTISEGPALGDYTFGQTIRIDCNDGINMLFFDENSVIAQDDCGDVKVELLRSRLSGSGCSNGLAGSWTLTWVATDLCGNQTREGIDIIVDDNTPPTITRFPVSNCKEGPNPKEIVLQDNCTHSIDYTYTIDTVYYESCQETFTLRYSYKAWDACGNAAEFVKEYQIDDNQSPMISFVDNNLQSGDTILMSCPEFGNVNLHDYVQVFDNCAREVSLEVRRHAPITPPCQGEILNKFEWVATDGCQNQERLLLYFDVRDQEPPVIQNFDNQITIYCENDIPQKYVTTDCNPAPVDISFTDQVEEGDCPSDKRIERTITVVDGCGNQNTYNQTIIVSDNQAPVMTSSGIICGTTYAEPIEVKDQCGLGIKSLVLLAKRDTQSCPGYTEITEYWESTDHCGNVGKHARRFILDNVKPVIQFSYSIGDFISGDTLTVDCSFPDIDKSYFSAIDQCGSIPISYKKESDFFQCDDNHNDFFKIESIYVSAVDLCGNKDSILINLAYTDNQAPELSAYPEDITIACDTDIEPLISAYDQCLGSVQVEYSKSIVNANNEFTQQWRAVDGCGNDTTHTRKVTQIDGINAEIIAPDKVSCWSTFTLDSEVTGGTQPYTYNWHIVSGECTIEYSEEDKSSVDIVVLTGSVVVRLTVVDANGCKVVLEYETECERGAKAAGRNIATHASVIYPNPANQYLFVDTDRDITNTYVVDAAGKTIIYNDHNIIGGTTEKINIEQLVDGSYFLILHSHKSIESHHFVKVSSQK